MNKSKQTVGISRKVKRVKLQRYLLSKIAYEDDWSYRHLAGLYLNQLWLEEKSLKDEAFQKKFKKMVLPLSELLKEINFTQGFNQRARARLSRKIKTEFEVFLVPKRNFKQQKSRFDNSVVYIDPQPTGTLNKQLKPQRFVGIGYRDKGTARDPARDGSQSWQEIAQVKSKRSQFDILMELIHDSKDLFTKRYYQKQAAKFLKKEREKQASDRNSA